MGGGADFFLKKVVELYFNYFKDFRRFQRCHPGGYARSGAE